jgi:hypothetical protein
LIFIRDPQRSCLSLQERELEHGDNIFIIYSRSNHNYENFTVESYHVGSGRISGHFESRVVSGRVSSHLVSGHFGSRVGSSRVSGHLVSGHFGFQVVSGRVSGRLLLDHFGFRVVSCRVRSDIRSFSVGLFRAGFSSRVGFCHL